MSKKRNYRLFLFGFLVADLMAAGVLSLEELKEISPVFEKDVYDAISMDTCVNKRLTLGAPGRAVMEQVISLNEKWMEEHPAL